jgi:hypothetical protein
VVHAIYSEQCAEHALRGANKLVVEGDNLSALSQHLDPLVWSKVAMLVNHGDSQSIRIDRESLSQRLKVCFPIERKSELDSSENVLFAERRVEGLEDIVDVLIKHVKRLVGDVDFDPMDHEVF